MLNVADFITLEKLMKQIDAVVYNGLTVRGWHNDWDVGLSEYRPAIQQDRNEFVYLLCAIIEQRLLGGKCLQLGLGDGRSHEVWQCIFKDVWSVDNDQQKIDKRGGAGLGLILGSTHGSLEFCTQFCAPLDFLFIDAGHSLVDVWNDYYDYHPLVRPGGLIAFHDALPRKQFPEIEVHKFLATLSDLTIVGKEVGTAWMVKG